MKFKKGDRVLVKYSELDPTGSDEANSFIGVVTSIKNPGFKGYIMVQPDEKIHTYPEFASILPCFEEELTLIPRKATKNQIEALKNILI